MHAIITWAIPLLLGGLRFVAGSLAVQVLVGLGMGVVTYTGVDLTFAYLKGQAIANFAGLPADLVQLLGFMKVGNAISVVSSAYMARLTMTTVRTAAGALAVKRFLKL